MTQKNSTNGTPKKNTTLIALCVVVVVAVILAIVGFVGKGDVTKAKNELATQVEQLTADLGAAKTDVEKTAADLAAQTAAATDAQAKLDEVGKQLEENKTAQTKLGEELTAAKAALTEAQDTAKAASQQAAQEAQAKVAALEEQLAQAKAAQDQLTEELTAAKAAVTAAEENAKTAVAAAEESAKQAVAAAETNAQNAITEALSKAGGREIVVLYTNDVHCGVDTYFGYAGLASYRDKLLDEGNYVTLVDNGDAIQGEAVGTLSTGSYLIDIMNQTGYDIAVPGNHEFDYGMDRFMELTKAANFPYVSCNFVTMPDAKPVFDAYKIIEYDGVKVAYLGICTPKTITSSTPTYFQDENRNFIYGFCQDGDGTLLYSTVQSAVDAARAEGANYVVALAHLGVAEETSPWMSTEVIANTTGIDVVLDGHSHTVLPCEKVKNKEGKEVLLSSTGTKLAHVGVMRIASNGVITTSLLNWNNTVAEGISAIKEEFSALLNEVVAKTDVDLVIYEPGTDPAVRIVRNAETNLGDLCADAYRAMSGADIAFVNGGGVRANIKAGDVTYDNIIKVHPYGNALCMVEATGQEILDALEMGCRAVPGENGGFLQVSGLTYEIHTYVESSVKLDDNGLFQGVEGEYRVKNVKVAGEDLDLAKTYTLASHNYMIKNGGDGFTMFQDNNLLLEDTMLDNQVLINYITKNLGGVVGADYADPHGEGRIVAVPEAPAAEAPVAEPAATLQPAA